MSRCDSLTLTVSTDTTVSNTSTVTDCLSISTQPQITVSNTSTVTDCLSIGTQLQITDYLTLSIHLIYN